MADKPDVGQQLLDLLKAAYKETGAALKLSAEELKTEIQASAARLSAAVGQPGYSEALLAERDVIALRAGVQASLNGDAIDNRITGLIQGALAILVAAL